MEPESQEITGGLEIQGFRYSYRVYPRPSERPPVLFVSGAFQTMDSWKKFADHFRASRTVVLCDLPGTGRSDVLPWEYGLDFLALALRKALDRVGIDRTDVISASYGSTIAYQFARRFPERVGSLVLAGVMREIPAHQWEPTARTLVSLGERRMAEFAREVADGLLCRDPEKTVERREVARRLLLGQLERMGEEDRQRYVQSTLRLLRHAPLDLGSAPPVRTLVFTGEHDVYTRPEYCREIAAAFRDSTSTTIRNADHLFHIERFSATLGLLSTFLNEDPVTAVEGVYGRVERRLGLPAHWAAAASSTFQPSIVTTGFAPPASLAAQVAVSSRLSPGTSVT